MWCDLPVDLASLALLEIPFVGILRLNELIEFISNDVNVGGLSLRTDVRHLKYSLNFLSFSDRLLWFVLLLWSIVFIYFCNGNVYRINISPVRCPLQFGNGTWSPHSAEQNETFGMEYKSSNIFRSLCVAGGKSPSSENDPIDGRGCGDVLSGILYHCELSVLV